MILGKSKRIENRRIENHRIWNSAQGYINGQARGPVAEMHMGNNRIADVGCETIAIYNAFLKNGKKTTLPDVIYEIEKHHLTWFHLGGCFGVNPKSISKYLDIHQVAYQKHLNYQKFIEEAKRTGNPCIMGFHLANSIFRVHTVALYWDGTKWNIYNLYNNSPGVCRFDDLEPVTKTRKFIVGYILSH